MEYIGTKKEKNELRKVLNVVKTVSTYDFVLI